MSFIVSKTETNLSLSNFNYSKLIFGIDLPAEEVTEAKAKKRKDGAKKANLEVTMCNNWLPFAIEGDFYSFWGLTRANEFDRKKCDVYYIPPNGNRIRSYDEMDRFCKYYLF